MSSERLPAPTSRTSKGIKAAGQISRVVHPFENTGDWDKRHEKDKHEQDKRKIAVCMKHDD